MTSRRALLSLLALGMSGASRAQTKGPAPGKRKLAVLLLKGRDKDARDFERELRAALADFGWIADRNLTIEWHFADGDRSRLPALAAKIVRSAPDAILTAFVPPTKALQLATTTIPIVTSVGDPVEYGFAVSYAHPGGNITGLSLAYAELQRKKTELLRNAVPSATRVILAYMATDASIAPEVAKAPTKSALEFGFRPEVALLGSFADLQSRLRSDGSTAVIAYGFESESSPVKMADLIAFSLTNKLPLVVDHSESVALGALLSYELFWDNQLRQRAAQLDKVLRGVSPAQIPFELPTRSWLAVNLKTARALGLTLPQSLLVRADEVTQ